MEEKISIKEKLSGIKLSKKRIIAIAVAAAVLIVGISVGIYAGTNKTKFYGDILYIFMDKSVEATDGSGIVWHIRKNSEYDEKKADLLLESYELYYEDEKGEEHIYRDYDKIESDGAQIGADLVILEFIANGYKNINKVVKPALIIAIIVIIAAIILLWFRSWSKREDEAKKRNNKRNNRV